MSLNQLKPIYKAIIAVLSIIAIYAGKEIWDMQMAATKAAEEVTKTQRELLDEALKIQEAKTDPAIKYKLEYREKVKATAKFLDDVEAERKR